MKAILVQCPLGILAFNKENKLVDKALLPKNPQEAASVLVQIEAGKIIDEIIELINRLQRDGYDLLISENEIFAQVVKEKLAVEVQISKPCERGETLRSRIELLAVETGFVENSAEFRQWLHDLAQEVAKLRVKKAIEKKDLIVTQAIQTLDDLDKTINLFMGRVREWYGIHFPELSRLIDKHETYARLVLKLGDKDNFTDEKLEKVAIPKSKAEKIAKSAETSMGSNLTETDLIVIQALCSNILKLYQLRQRMEDYLDTAMKEVAPNIRTVVGGLLGARLIALAGGLRNLAKMPSSTIQVLGAEKALFRSLRSGARPPKHGIIFQDSLLHDAEKWQRGKIARVLAGKLAIAARTDAFGGRDLGQQLRTGLEKRVEEIRKKHVRRPQISKRKSRQKRRRKKRHAGKD